MFAIKGRQLLALFLMLAFTTLVLIIVTPNLNADEKSSTEGYKTATTAAGGKDHNTPIFRAWADYFGKLYSDSKRKKVKGKYKLIAFVAGGSNPSDREEKFTLKKRWGIFGDEEWVHHYDTAQWTGTDPYAYAQAGGKLGSLTNKTEKWNP